MKESPVTIDFPPRIYYNQIINHNVKGKTGESLRRKAIGSENDSQLQGKRLLHTEGDAQLFFKNMSGNVTMKKEKDFYEGRTVQDL